MLLIHQSRFYPYELNEIEIRSDKPNQRKVLFVFLTTRATFYLAHLCGKVMLKQGHGHFIAMSPPIDFQEWPLEGNLSFSHKIGKVGYSISKLGMTMVAQGMAQEMKGKGVAANALW